MKTKIVYCMLLAFVAGIAASLLIERVAKRPDAKVKQLEQRINTIAAFVAKQDEVNQAGVEVFQQVNKRVSALEAAQ